MPDDRRKRFGPYVRALADLMGLRDWTVQVSDDPPGDARLAGEADCVYGRKWINVALSEWFFRKGEDEQRNTVCHELVHAHLAAMHHYLHRTLDGPQWDAYQLTMEYAVDGIAREWAPHLPLPSAVLGAPKARRAPKGG